MTAAASPVLKITNQAIKKVKRVMYSKRSTHLIAQQSCYNANQWTECATLLLFSAVTLQQRFPCKLSNSHGLDAERLVENVAYEHSSIDRTAVSAWSRVAFFCEPFCEFMRCRCLTRIQNVWKILVRCNWN